MGWQLHHTVLWLRVQAAAHEDWRAGAGAGLHVTLGDAHRVGASGKKRLTKRLKTLQNYRAKAPNTFFMGSAGGLARLQELRELEQRKIVHSGLPSIFDPGPPPAVALQRFLLRSFRKRFFFIFN